MTVANTVAYYNMILVGAIIKSFTAQDSEVWPSFFEKFKLIFAKKMTL